MRLGPYEVLSPLGAGGMGEVWRAQDTRLSREVALKVLPAEVSSDPSRLKRFEKEARAASALNHPNIVTIYDIGVSDSVSWIAMEKIDGKTLREVLLGGAVPIRKLLPIAAQIADGLAKAHEAGIVHRDLKPENVMMTKDGLVKILDFGLAKLATTGSGSDEASHLPTETGTSPGVVLGTVGYMSPEQAAGQLLDFRSDQFSFGSILYEMATGKRAFQKKTAIDTLSAILNEEPEPVGSVNPQAPAPLRWIVERCLAKEPENRYAATRDLSRDLATIRDHASEAVSGPVAPARRRSRSVLLAAAVAAALIAAALLSSKAIWSARTPPQPSYHRLTFRRGLVDAARFAPDGRTILYSALWDGDPPHIFESRPESPESRRLDLPDGSLMSVSSRGELAVLTAKPRIGEGWWFASGTLATAPLAGGAPREVAEDVRFADWARDGKGMLVARQGRLEFPIGKVIRERPDMGEWAFSPRLSPAGNRIAFGDSRRVHIADLSGRELAVSRPPVGFSWLAWSPKGNEVWFTTGEGSRSSLRGMTEAGKERLLLRMPLGMRIEDVSPDGRLLVVFQSARSEVWAKPAGETRERDVTVLSINNAMGLTPDGKWTLVNVSSVPNQPEAFCLRSNDGTLTKKLGEGFGSELSADGKWVAVTRPGPPAQLVLVPTGAGDEKVLEPGAIEAYDRLYVRWSQDGRRLLFGGHEKGRADRLFVQEVTGGAPRPVTPEGMDAETASISPDGRFVIVQTGKDFWIYPTDGGEKRAASGFLPTDYIWRNWSEDGRFAYAWNLFDLPFRVFRVELATGRREPWMTVMPQDPAGIFNGDFMITPDGKSYAYNCSRLLTDLYLVEGLK
jgi:eukaryotic-like serine/threonine-protein kinase